MSPATALIVRCYNEEAHIGRLLTGALRQTHVPAEIVVVDSGSSDATLAIASAFPVRIVQIDPADFSFGRALNLGLASATSDLAVFASAHVYPLYDSWIERLIAPLEHPDVALAYGRQQTPPDARFSEQQLMARWFPSHSVTAQRHPFCNTLRRKPDQNRRDCYARSSRAPSTPAPDFQGSARRRLAWTS